MPGSENEAAGLLDAYLAAEFAVSNDTARSVTGELIGEQLARDVPNPLG